MKLSVSAYRAHASAHKKILDTAYQLNYGSTSASSHQNTAAASTTSQFKVEPATTANDEPGQGPQCPPGRMTYDTGGGGGGLGGGPSAHHLTADSGSDTPANSPRSPMNTSRDEDDDSSNAPSSECKSPNQRYGRESPGTKSNQRWMKLRTTVQISSAIQKKPPLKREDSFLKRFSTRQIPETQETVEDTGSEGGGAAGGGSTAPRRRRRYQKSPRTVVNPDENFYFYWLFVLTICVLYNMWALIVRQSFPEFQTLCSRFWYTCDAMSDIVFLLDVGVQLRTGYLEQGLMVYDSKKLAGHYLHSRPFLLDLGALCPLDMLQIRFGSQPMLRFPRFLKVYRAINYYYMVESRTVWPNLWRVVNLIHILLILAHWFGCFYFLLSEAEGFQGDWVYPYRPGDYATLTRKYLGSLYWSTLTLTTIGDLPTPETNAEKTVTVDGLKSLPRRGLKSRLLQFKTDGGYVFTIVSYLIGVFIFATIVGQVGNVITNRNANRLEFERLLDGAKTYMRHHKVPSGMKKRVLRWYDYSWSRGRIQGGGDINTALGLLPDKLKTELALHVNLSVLKKVTIFQECQPEFLHDLVLKMKAYIFTPGDSICRKGEVAREMFIIADGILEVLSETGRVLTTMKAGDFFGEIGILNLDGLNKRTADVRSVGYSELFSLSREDVLAAMKDYPEAQEILQSLGRKRLMEVRNSARHPPSTRSSKHHRDHHQLAGGDGSGGHGADGSRGLVGKIKSEAKGLRNALRKSRAYRKSDESLELQPLHTPNKGVLKRMPRVRSDEMSQEDAPDPGGGVMLPDTTSGGVITSPLGAGLPLLSRLRLLKEKQDNEERVGVCSGIPSPSSVVTSPPPPPVPDEPEVIGAGLPLLQRLLLLKAKEDRQSPPVIPVTTMITPPSTTVVVSMTTSSILQQSRSPSPALSPKPALGKISFKDRLLAMRTTATECPKKDTEVESVPIVENAPDVVKDTTGESKAVLELVNSCDDSGPWTKLKQAAIVRDNSQALIIVNPPANEPLEPVCETSARRTKPTLLRLQESRTKNYESVDDLSPEYGGLPFVKKLKILNERQKLAELESAMKTRSVSLDIPEQPYDDLTLTRSHSEASAMHKRNRLTPSTFPQTPTSPESNETPERRNLKSILKKLSEDVRTSTSVQIEPEPEEVKQAEESEFRKLMRAPTVEGYAARHSKLAKSVTFNRDTLQSPPSVGGSDVSVCTPPLNVTTCETGNGLEAEPAGPSETEDDPVFEPEQTTPIDQRNIQVVCPQGNQLSQVKKGPLDEHEYFGEALVAIKQVINAHLQEMQQKYQTRFDRLEQEVRSRDTIIGQLRQHIHDLEKSIDDSYTGSDSLDTVIHRGDRRSWDEPNNQECIELQDLPPTMRPQRAWSPPEVGSVVLDLDSATDDTGSEAGDGEDSSEPGETDTYMHNSNWEVEMLAAQMRQQRRSASFDQNASATRAQVATRRRLCRGYSADAGGRD